MTETPRLDALIASMSARLRPLCAEWPEDVFTNMVRRLAEITLKHDGQDVSRTDGRRAALKLMHEMKEMLRRNDAAREYVERSWDDASNE